MSEKIVVLSRDPFARLDHVRMVEETSADCAWCGNSRPEGRLFFYGVWLDNGHTVRDSRGFCSKGCRESYQS